VLPPSLACTFVCVLQLLWNKATHYASLFLILDKKKYSIMHLSYFFYNTVMRKLFMHCIFSTLPPDHRDMENSQCCIYECLQRFPTDQEKQQRCFYEIQQQWNTDLFLIQQHALFHSNAAEYNRRKRGESNT